IGSSDGGTTGNLVTCPSGSELIHYSLAELAQPPTTTELELPNLPSQRQVLSAGTGQSYSARFDLCRNSSGAHSLRAGLCIMEDVAPPYYFVIDENISAPIEAHVGYGGGLVFLIRLPPSSFIVSGLDEAVGGDLQPLEVRVVNGRGLIVMGHAN